MCWTAGWRAERLTTATIRRFAELGQPPLQMPAVGQGLPQEGGQFGGNIAAHAFAAFGEREEEGLVLASGLAGGTVGADAGLSHLGQGPLGQGPERGQFVEERLMVGKSLGFGHGLCISY